jgi:mRNA interferase MazF
MKHGHTFRRFRRTRLVPFPFSDLSNSKKRPAIVIASAGRGDWILCQVTSNPYSQPNSITLDATDFFHGGLQIRSYARPAKLFAANESLIILEVGHLAVKAIQIIRNQIITLISA